MNTAKAVLLFTALMMSHLWAQSTPLATDRGRVTVASIPDPFGGSNLKVLRSDTNTPLRAGTAWIWEKQRQEEPESYYASMRAKGLNAVRMILFDTWEIDEYTTGAPSYTSLQPWYTPTSWNDPAYRTRQLARMERAVNYASANGMYVIINSHNKIPKYDEPYANALWTHVAPYFANRTHVLYELANEPLSGIGNNGDMDAPGGNALNSPRLQALKRGYDIARAGAPDTHLMILTPPGINDYATGTGMGNLAASFAALPGTAVDWTKTSVAYHLYNNDAAFGAANNAANLRNLHKRYPAWPSENAFPPGNFPGADGLDTWRSPSFPINGVNDLWVNQTCERLGLGWSMWFMNGQAQLDINWPIMMADANAKGWNWTADVLPTTAPVFTSPSSATFSQDLAGSHQMAATGGSVTFAATGLPAGLTLNPATGLISGSTSTAGKINVNVSAINSVGTTPRTLVLDIIPTQDTSLYSQAFGAGNTANWFSYSGGSSGITNSLVNEASGTTDGRVLKLTITAPNTGGYAGAGVGISGTPPFTAAQSSRIIVRGRLQVTTPAATNLSVMLKTANGQDFSLPLTPGNGTWLDFSAPLPSFTANNFNFSASSWEILLVPNLGLWGTGISTVRLDSIEILRRDDITDPLQSWRKIHFGNAMASTDLYAHDADFDGDGVKNLLEYALGGHPLLPETQPLVRIEIPNQNAAISFNRISDPGLIYEILTSGNLGQWNTVPMWSSTGIENTAGSITVPDTETTTSQGRKFYRIHIRKP